MLLAINAHIVHGASSGIHDMQGKLQIKATGNYLKAVLNYFVGEEESFTHVPHI